MRHRFEDWGTSLRQTKKTGMSTCAEYVDFGDISCVQESEKLFVIYIIHFWPLFTNCNTFWIYLFLLI